MLMRRLWRLQSDVLMTRIGLVVGQWIPRDTCGLGVDKLVAPNVGVSVVVFEGRPSRGDVQYTNLFGSWMLVEQRCKRPMPVDMYIKQLLNAQYGSRFAVL
ncbi:hypothetical protein V6N11_072932 [Hibiscus sabdariffa]|uniref:Uncharacterized protein n=2 Tax=Hibiscus sabdariffa TaxID=183260 RepID=A0ABR2NWR4_9ROSI